MHLDSSWEEEPEGGFNELLEEVSVTKIPLSPIRPATCNNEAPLINGIMDKRIPWKLIAIDIPAKDRKLRDPHIKKCKSLKGENKMIIGDIFIFCFFFQ